MCHFNDKKPCSAEDMKLLAFACILFTPACSFFYWLVPSSHLHCFWPLILQVCIWEGLQPFHPRTAVSVTALCTLGCHPWKCFSYQWGSPCGNTGTVSSNHVHFIWYHLVCGELTLHRCLADGNWMWICHKLSPVTTLREPKSPNVKCTGMESWL